MMHSNHHIEPDATVHDLMNEATQWLQYAKGVTTLLAELVHESDSIDCARVSLAMEAIGAMMQMGLQCATEAHARTCWEKNVLFNKTSVD